MFAHEIRAVADDERNRRRRPDDRLRALRSAAACAGELVQDLRKRGIHARSLPRSQNHDVRI